MVWLKILLLRNLVSMLLRLVGGQAVQGLVRVPAEVAGVGDAGDVVGLDVLPDVVPGSLLPTNSADPCLPIFRQVHIANQHHRPDLFIQDTFWRVEILVFFVTL